MSFEKIDAKKFDSSLTNEDINSLKGGRPPSYPTSIYLRTDYTPATGHVDVYATVSDYGSAPVAAAPVRHSPAG
ncbi:MAG: hypothetical protein WBA74_02930 [Cyclobacteriaceae bacterium]